MSNAIKITQAADRDMVMERRQERAWRTGKYLDESNSCIITGKAAGQIVVGIDMRHFAIVTVEQAMADEDSCAFFTISRDEAKRLDLPKAYRTTWKKINNN